MGEYVLSLKQREDMTSDQVAMLILQILQRNHLKTNTGSGPYISYYPFSIGAILSFELNSRDLSGESLSKNFQYKFAEAVNSLKQAGYIMQDPTQTHAVDFQIPTSKGLAIDTTAPAFGITSPSEFLRQVEAKAGSLDEVAKAYLSQSYEAAENNLWLSSVFMLGAASERLIYILSDSVDRLLADPAQSVSLNRITKVRQRKEWIVEQLPALKAKLPSYRQAFTDVEDKFDSLYNAYRYLRNDAGHPRSTLPVIHQDQIKAMLFGFSLYAEAVNTILAIP